MKQQSPFRRIIKILVIAIPLLLLLVIAGFWLWSRTSSAEPASTAQTVLTQANVQENDGRILFFPPDNDAETAFIFYPGGLVEPGAYAPVARAIADAGYLVIIPEMPLNLAVFGFNRANGIIADYPDIESWAIGGHSLGGAMAATFTNGNLEEIDGLILYASYPAESADLSDTSLPILSVYGTLDGLATVANVDEARPLLPETTEYVPIDGGNHAQFGDYGFQDGDLGAEISAEDQWSQIAEATVNFLSSIP